MVKVSTLWTVALGGCTAGIVMWLIYGGTTGLACGFGMLAVAIYASLIAEDSK